MRIQIKNGEQNLNLRIPTGLVFNKGVVWLANHVGRRYAGDAMKDIPPEALDAFFAEFRRIKKQHGQWELVNMESSNGDIVKIVL